MAPHNRLWMLRKRGRASKKPKHPPRREPQICHISNENSWAATFDFQDEKETTQCLDRRYGSCKSKSTVHSDGRKGVRLWDASFFRFNATSGEVTICERWKHEDLAGDFTGEASTTVTLKPGTYAMRTRWTGRSGSPTFDKVPEYEITLTSIPNTTWSVSYKNSCHHIFGKEAAQLALSQIGTFQRAGQEHIMSRGGGESQALTIQLFDLEMTCYFKEYTIRACGEESLRVVANALRKEVDDVQDIGWRAFQLSLSDESRKLVLSAMTVGYAGRGNGKKPDEDLRMLFEEGWKSAERAAQNVGPWGWDDGPIPGLEDW